MPQTAVLPPPQQSTASESVYNRAFWMAYIANVSLVMANALTFRFAELVAFLGGSENDAGTIVSLGVLGALVARFFLGQAIDRYGTRRLWMLSSLTFISSCALFVAVSELTWVLYVARAGFTASLAGMFTCSIVHIQNRVPANRRTEVIGSLGSSGFVGMILGTQLGDLIFNSLPDGAPRFAALFGTSCGLGVFYGLIVIRLTRHDRHRRPDCTPSAHKLLLRYWPGNVMLAAIVMGVGFTVITVFLTRFSTHLYEMGKLSRSGIGTFFTGYATSAFIIRLMTRHWSRTMGRHRMILLGITGHCIGQSLLPFVTQEWQFLIPAVACGWAHALLFPAVISLGAGAFPLEYRGSGTTIVLGFTEVGAMLSGKPLGWIIDHFDGHGFAQMFWSSAAFCAVSGIVYALTAARTHDCEIGTQPEPARGHKPAERYQVAHCQPQRVLAGGLSAEEMDEPDDQPGPEDSVAVPFPHLGRSG